MNRNIFIAIALSLLLISCAQETKEKNNAFISTKGHQFIKNGEPYYFVGTNYWYGGILASEGIGGDRDRLIKELDLMQQTGILNLRVLVGAEGPNNQPYRVTPALQMEPGVYNDTLLDGLDFLMNELAKRDMQAVLFLNNTWEWSGGFAQYVNWNGYGDIPYPQFEENTWPEFMEYASQFLTCEPCKKQNQEFIKFILSRTNRYNGLKYTEDPAIMTWEIANEPRALSDDKKQVFAEWIKETADFIKSLDTNHLVTTGTEGSHGCQEDIQLFKTIHSYESVDYLCMHIWPNNWGWINIDSIPETIDGALVMADNYMSEHMAVAEELQKPIVFEEFGLPRDNFSFKRNDPTTARDKFYSFAFDMIEENAKNNGVLAGSNFWAFGGYGKHYGDDPFWKVGDDLMGDPPQEEQGLNSVFDTDSTIEIIKQHSDNLKQIKNHK